MYIRLFKFRIRTAIIVFILFFVFSLLEVFQTKNWIAVGYWSLIALMFLILDSEKKQKAKVGV
jgi:hypothetical protein